MSFGERFLEHPDLFPSRINGEVCGNADVLMDCAGGPYRVSGLSAAQHQAIRERFAEFCLDAPHPPPPAIEVRIFSVPASDFTRAAFPGGVYSFDSDFQRDAVHLAGREFMARLQLRPRFSVAVWTPHDREFIAYGDFENVVRVLIAYRLLDAGGLLLHSSGVVIDGGAHVFFGYSGAGKTTVAKLGLRRGYPVLSDDINVLIPAAAGLTAMRSPFAGAMGRTPVPGDSYPVRGLYLLEKGEKNAMRTMTRAAAVSSLLARSPFVNHDHHRADQLVDNLFGLVETIPVSVLTFTQAGDFWGLLLQDSSEELAD